MNTNAERRIAELEIKLVQVERDRDREAAKVDRLERENAQLKATTQREQIMPNAVYLTDEVAELLRCEPVTIRRAVRLGEIRTRGKPFRILGSEILKYAAAEPSRYFR